MISYSKEQLNKFLINLKKWFEVKPEDYADVEDDFFQLIQTAYKEVGGHVKIKDPDDVFTSGWNYWVAVDIDADIDVEIVKGYKVTQFGYKSAVVGHDGSKQAKQEYLKKFTKDLKIKGQYAEVSHKIAQILINKYNVHIVDNPDAIEAVVGKPGNPIKFYGKHPTDSSMPGEGWYERKIAGKPIIKTLVGRPLVKETANPENPTLLVLHGYESSVYPQRLKDLSKDYNNCLIL